MEVLEEVIINKKKVLHKKPTEEIYERTFPRVAAFVSHMGGSFDDAKDIFHDALVIYFELSSDHNRVTIQTTEESYILGIAKHLWIRKYKHDKKNISLSEIEKEINLPDDYFPTIENKRLLRFLESAGRKCMDLLRAFYYEQIPISKLANALGYSNEHSASVQKYKCLEKVRNTIKEKSLRYEDFME
jgi:DNA-directed RNA polymerase specialized sigma24 family protein